VSHPATPDHNDPLWLIALELAHAYQGPLGMVLAGASGTVAGLRYLRAAQPVAQHRDARGIPIPA
jgi:hypothetical protein